MKTLFDKLHSLLPEVIDSLHREAKGGCVQSCKILLDAALSQQLIKVDQEQSLSDIGHTIVTLSLDGQLSSKDAKQLMSLLESQAALLEHTELIKIVEQLENNEK